MSVSPVPTPPERRSISNEILAFQLTTLQEAQTTQSHLLREQIREGFTDVRLVLDKHTVDIGDLKIALAKQDARTTALETFRAEAERRREEDVRRTESDNRAGEADADQLRFYKWLGGGVVSLLGLVIAVLTIVTFFGSGS